MSRIGKLPVPVPSGVKIELDGSRLAVKGPRGELQRDLPAPIKLIYREDQIVCERPSDSRIHRSLHGLTRSLVANMVTGVSEGFRREMELVGVGYRAQKQGSELVLSLGFSHQVRYPEPPGITFEVADATHFSVSGCNKEQVGQVAAEIQRIRPPEPYKGKGVLFRGQRVRRKAGKAGKGGKGGKK